jgi:hypothetical protein
LFSLLTDNIRWVHALTLEGDRLTADDIVLRRDMIAGVRVDMLGVRVSFLLVAVLLLLNLCASVVAFVDTLQFFDPDYTVFALSLLPLPLLMYGAYQLRPRRHLTLLLRDGSALGVLSGDGNFLTRCLEAFERLWAAPSGSDASLYLHAAHRSVDFGPPPGGIDVLANTRREGPMALSLPVFAEEEEDTADPSDRRRKPVAPVDEPEPEVDHGAEPSLPFPSMTFDDEPEPEGDQKRGRRPEAPETAVEPGDDDEGDTLPPFPPPLPPLPEQDGEEDDEAGEPDEPVAVEPEPEPVFTGDPERVPAEAFVAVRPKVEALVRLLRERAPAQGINDAVDVLELMTRRGCTNPREVRALARSVDLLRERMSSYPTAVDLLDAVNRAGQLKIHPAVH